MFYNNKILKKIIYQKQINKEHIIDPSKDIIDLIFLNIIDEYLEREKKLKIKLKQNYL